MINRIIHRIKRLISSLYRKFGLVDIETIYFEGGLGSQILAYLELLGKCEIHAKEPSKLKPMCDATYFARNVGYEKDGLRIGPWLLNEYGLSVKDLEPYSRRKISKFAKVRAGVNEKIEFINGAYYFALAQKYRDVVKNERDIIKFAVNEVGLHETEANNTDGLLNCCAIHIRRGDYLQVASHIISDNDYMMLLKKIESFIPDTFVIFSDSILGSEFKREIVDTFKHKKVIFCEGNKYQEIDVHNFMRSAKVLVTGNSTFSLTAGFLANRNSIVFSPIKFYGGLTKKENTNPFISAGEFFLLK
jgi:hypothetical protein